MKNLIKITTKEQGLSVVSARELHDYLEAETPLTIWMPRMLEYGFEEGKDFVTFLLESTGGGPLTDYALTLDMASEISMIQRTKKDKKARTCLIKCEKIAKEANILMSPVEQLLANAQLLVDIERKQKESESRISKTKQAVLMLEAKSQKSVCTMQSEKHTHRINPWSKIWNYQNVSRNYFEKKFLV
jgi:anti-repressor protein